MKWLSKENMERVRMARELYREVLEAASRDVHTNLSDERQRQSFADGQPSLPSVHVPFDRGDINVKTTP